MVPSSSVALPSVIYTVWPPSEYTPLGMPRRHGIADEAHALGAEPAEHTAHHSRMQVDAVGDHLHMGRIIAGRAHTPGSRWLNGGMALNRCVTWDAPRGKGRLGLVELAVVCAMDTTRIFAGPLDERGTAPGSSGATSMSLMAPAGQLIQAVKHLDLRVHNVFFPPERPFFALLKKGPSILMLRAARRRRSLC